MMLPDSLLENKRWGEHYKYWLNYFNISKDIVDDIIRISQEVDDSTLNSYYIELSPTRGIQNTNPLGFALVTCNQISTILQKAETDQEFNSTFYTMIFTTFIESAYFVLKNDLKWMVNPILFDFYKSWIDWFGFFHNRLYSNFKAYKFEKELLQKYYVEIFNINNKRAAKTAVFWWAIGLGVIIPIDYIYNSLLEQTTSFAIDNDDLFYIPINRYWIDKNLDLFHNITIQDFQNNIISFMEQLRQHDELCLLISVR